MDKMSEVLGRASRAPFYAGRGYCAEKWGEIPLTTKANLREAYPFGFLAVPREQLATYHESSGTSGKPISSYFTENDWQDVSSRFLRSDIQLSSKDMVMVKTPYALVTTAHQMHHAARSVGATVVPADNRSSNMPYARVIRLLSDLPITVAWCLPTEVLLWAVVARKMGLSPERDFPHLRAFLVAGEALSPARKRMLARIWGHKRIVEDYGSTETGSLAGECSHGKMHLWSDRVHAEIRDLSSGEVRTSGRGSLVVTPLHREGMPLVRYDMEDDVHLSTESCPCGSKFPTIEVYGRKAVTVAGRNLHARELEDIVYADDAVTFWRAKAHADRLEVELAEPASSERLREAISAAWKIPAEIRSVSAERFFPEAMMKSESPMQKPRFIFSANEDWDNAITYA